MTADRRIPVSTTPGAVTGDSFMDAAQEELTKLYDISITKLQTVAGTNTITATYDPPLTGSLVDGMRFELVPAATTTSATVTLNGKTIVDRDGSAPVAGSLRLGSKYLLSYDLSADKFYCLTYLPQLAFVDRPSWRNIAIDNGGFEIWQRGAGDSASIAVAASTTAYTADRWYITTAASCASVVSAQAGLSDRSRKCARVQRNSGQTGTAIIFTYPLTTDECIRLRGQRISMSFKARGGANLSDTSLQFIVFFGTGSEGKRGAGFTGESSPINTNVTLTADGTTIVSGSATSSATVATNVTQGEIFFVWNPTGTASTNDYVELDDVQVEAAVAPTEFEYAPFAFMLAQCQRHYAKTFAYGTSPAQNAGIINALSGRDDGWLALVLQAINSAATLGGVADSTHAPALPLGPFAFWRFPSRMRTTPTVTTFNPSAANANWRSPGGSNGSAQDVTRTISPDSSTGDAGVTIVGAGTSTNNFGNSFTTAQVTACYIHATADASL